MAARELIYKFDELPAGSLTVEGEANVEYEIDGSWNISLVFIGDAFDGKGDLVHWASVKEKPSVKEALIVYRSAAIQSAVDEAIHRRAE